MCERRVASWLAAGIAAGLAAATLAVASPALAHQAPVVQIWSDRGEGGLYAVGDCAQLAFRPETDCYVIVYGIDTDGYLRVLFPGQCGDDGYVLGGRTYSIWRDGFYKFYINGPAGIEYVHVLASYEPFRQIYWQGCDGYEDYAQEATWRGFHDYWGCAMPPRVYGDPYAAMQMIDEFICLDALEAGKVWADFTYFYVDARVSYPRYLCYDCHGFDCRFRPYNDVCAAFTVSFVDCDPCYSQWSWWWWCSPGRCYCGPQYICRGRDGWCDSREHGHGGWHHGDHATYPSEYKWKSRGDGGEGLVVPAVARAPVGRVGNPMDAVRVRSDERQVDLYTRKSAAQNEYGVRDAARTDRKSREMIEREASQVRSGDLEIKQHHEVKTSDHAVRSDKAKGRSLLGSVVSHLLRSGDGGSKSKPKGTNPQVRGGDKGKSPETRRKVSR